MSRFDLSNYETVKSRKAKFYKDYPDGRVLTEIHTLTDTQTVIKATIYKSLDDQKANAPFATGHAQEFQGQGGMANRYAWTENCEESAVGRALDNAGYASSASREEMQKVDRHEKSSQSVASSRTIQQQGGARPTDGGQSTKQAVSRTDYLALGYTQEELDDFTARYQKLTRLQKQLLDNWGGAGKLLKKHKGDMNGVKDEMIQITIPREGKPEERKQVEGGFI